MEIMYGNILELVFELLNFVCLKQIKWDKIPV